jgi:two-component system cell cycle response regulator DivK
MERYAAAASGNGKTDGERPPNGGTQASKGPHTILVVDDDGANLVLARALLEAEGFHVLTATDAISTFDAIKEREPALILMDIQLPGMDGWELTRRLKKNIATSHIPVIGLTAYGTHGDEKRARDAGFSEFVAKPVSTRDLPAIIRRNLAR